MSVTCQKFLFSHVLYKQLLSYRLRVSVAEQQRYCLFYKMHDLCYGVRHLLVLKYQSDNTSTFKQSCAKKIWYDNIKQYLFLWHTALYRDPYIVMRIISWSPCQYSPLKLSDTKEHFCHLFSCFQFQCVLCFSVNSWSARNFIVHFNVIAATSVSLVIFPYHPENLDRKFWMTFFFFYLICPLNLQNEHKKVPGLVIQACIQK